MPNFIDEPLQFARSIDLGRRLLDCTAIGLIAAGLSAMGIGLSGRFLPHDERFLGMTAQQLCSLNGCRIVHFMAHDRISFGAAVVTIGLLYLWLAEYPLRQKQAWAWWVLLLSGVVGFSSFFAYLGYGYLDAWHGAATIGLLCCFIVGMSRAARAITPWIGIRCVLEPAVHRPWRSPVGVGFACFLATAAALIVAGIVILTVGMTVVFVPQDLVYLGMEVDQLHAINSRLVPLIAHDRAGFGGAMCSAGVALFFCIWCGKPSPNLWIVLCLIGIIGFGSAIGVHPAVGYNDPVHLAPAIGGAVAYIVGLVLTFRWMVDGGDN